MCVQPPMNYEKFKRSGVPICGITCISSSTDPLRSCKHMPKLTILRNGHIITRKLDMIEENNCIREISDSRLVPTKYRILTRRNCVGHCYLSAPVRPWFIN